MSGYIGDRVYCKACGNHCGYEYDLRDGAFYAPGTEKAYCSEECFANNQPIYCAECHDVDVEKKGDLCTYCMITKEQGEEAAEAWLDAQIAVKKPPASVRREDVKENKRRA